jgi:hypothetical protein
MKSIMPFFFGFRGYMAQAMVFFRMAMGILLALHFLAALPDFERLFSTSGILPTDILDLYATEYIITLPGIVSFLTNYGISRSLALWMFKVLYLGLSLCIAVGFFSRWAAALLLFLHAAWMQGATLYFYGVDYFESMALLYLVLFPADRAYSLRARIGKPQTEAMRKATPYFRTFQIHVALIYFFSGLEKIVGFNWRNGESVWKAFHLYHLNRDFAWDFSFISDYHWLWVLMGWGVVIVKLFYPVFIAWHKSRRLWLWATIAFHLGIALVLNLYFFAATMIAWNLTAFYFVDAHKFGGKAMPQASKLKFEESI